MTSNALSKFLDLYLIDEQTNTYSFSDFTITNDGDLIDGSATPEILRGSTLSDIIWGNGGDDTIYGGGARDLLNGAKGDDEIDGGSGADRLQGQSGSDVLSGGKGNDALYGGQDNDHLYGGSGKDYLCGGNGQDSLWGGEGVDVFVFRPAVTGPIGHSEYHDWEIGVDQLRIDSPLMPDGFKMSMIQVEEDGSLYIQTVGGHKMDFETLDTGDIKALYDSVLLI